MNEKERLLKVLKGEKVDRIPVICPGGMMNAGVTEIIRDVEGHNLNCDSMVELSKRIYSEIGFENYGVPFCMTVECEPLGVQIDLGSKVVEPRVIEYNKNDIDTIIDNYNVNPLKDYRMPVVLEAIKKLKNDKVPVIGNITGHISTGGSIIDPLKLLIMIRKSPEKVETFFKYINDYLIKYAEEMVFSGADVITIADPTATGEILGEKNFERFALPFYQEFVEKIHNLNTPVIIHICGKAKNIINALDKTGADAISFDSSVNMKHARSMLKTRLMGNVSTLLLHTGREDKIISITKNCINSGVDIVSPACGLSMETPLNNLKSMTSYVKSGEYK